MQGANSMNFRSSIMNILLKFGRFDKKEERQQETWRNFIKY